MEDLKLNVRFIFELLFGHCGETEFRKYEGIWICVGCFATEVWCWWSRVIFIASE